MAKFDPKLLDTEALISTLRYDARVPGRVWPDKALPEILEETANRLEQLLKERK